MSRTYFAAVDRSLITASACDQRVGHRRTALGRPVLLVGRAPADLGGDLWRARVWSTAACLWLHEVFALQPPARFGFTTPRHWPLWMLQRHCRAYEGPTFADWLRDQDRPDLAAVTLDFMVPGLR